MAEHISPQTEYSLNPREKEWVDRFTVAQNAYREANPQWRFIPKLLGATASGVLVAADIISGKEGLPYLPPSWVVWMGSLREPILPKPAPIFSALTELDRGNSGTIGSHIRINPERVQENVAKLRELEMRGTWFPGVADGYEEFCRVNAQFGVLFLAEVRLGKPEGLSRLGDEDVLPIAGQDFYMSG